MKLGKREKIIHLYNRFGLGASEAEIEEGMGVGVDGTLDRLLNYEKTPFEFPVSVWEFVFYGDDKVAMDVGRVAQWWVLRMIATPRPLEEKLTLFWHSHFAVSGSKSEFGPMMFAYLNTLRAHAGGSFLSLLNEVSKSPAMVHWLDCDRSLKGRPNENFARELMELFTMGIGNYTEKDVQEAARAFSGWSIRYPYYELGKVKETDRVRFGVQHEMPLVVFQDSPELHDNGEKTYLGQKGAFTAEEILEMAARHPATAARTCRKLWEFFAYQNPEPAVVERLAKVFKKNDLQIKPVLQAIADSREFWGEQCVGTMVKSPVDFAVGAMRQVEASARMLRLRILYASYDTPIEGTLNNDAYAVRRNMADQGLSLLFPPDVSGWKWGPAWATAAGAIDRIRFADYLFSNRKGGPPAVALRDRLMKEATGASPDQIVDRLLTALATPLSSEKKAILVSACTKAGGAKALAKAATANTLLRNLTQLAFAAPEYHLC
ncbi:MAG: DUF1800 domain-containing protein [Fimbriimonas ginsengisoli]|uniref:DUF1800 domain-containing protein n=1 Tax=Fimbriimonas ginsengisoli TaxID=1005039 RepID=A0A931LVH5_FIMGI|nr:DUF1800 domain-containing protein [Fimbriimonas ginsengisoli]